MIKVIFFGTPEFVLPVAQSVLEAKNFRLVAVVTAPDKPVGRKQITTPSPVKIWAKTHKIKILDSPSIIRIIEQIKVIKPEVGVLAAYGKIIPKNLIDIFPKGILVIHPSLLPKYRGASPVQAALSCGEKETGVSVILMDEKVDHGPILWQIKEKILPQDTAQTLYQRLFEIAAKNLPAILKYYIFLDGRDKICNIGGGKLFLPPKPQNHQKATFTPLLKKDDGFIPPELLRITNPKPGFTSKCKVGPNNLEPTPENLERFIRAMSPWPGAWTTIQIKDDKDQKTEKRLKILKAHLEDTNLNSQSKQEKSPKELKEKSALPLKDQKKLVLDVVQLEGKKPVSFKQFCEGYPETKIAVISGGFGRRR